MRKNETRSAIFALAVLACVLFFTGCPEETEDFSIAEITIYNIPESFPVMGNDSISLSAFKVYLSASNSMSENDLPAAKGLARLDALTPVGGTYTVTMQLQKPNPDAPPPANYDDPNLDTGAWKGTARYFSVVICPQDTTGHGVNAIWMKAGTTLDKGKSKLNWNSLMDFREIIKNDPEDKGEFLKKATALFNELIRKDTDITKGP